MPAAPFALATLWVQPDNVPSTPMVQMVTAPDTASVAYRVLPLTANCHGYWKPVPVLMQPAARLPSLADVTDVDLVVGNGVSVT